MVFMLGNLGIVEWGQEGGLRSNTHVWIMVLNTTFSFFFFFLVKKTLKKKKKKFLVMMNHQN
jgi:hypothetical protein